MIGKIYAAPVMPEGFTIKSRALVDTIYQKITREVATLNKGQAAVYTQGQLEAEMSMPLPKCFRHSLGVNLKKAFGAGVEVLKLENKATGELAFRILKRDIPGAAKEEASK